MMFKTDAERLLLVQVVAVETGQLCSIGSSSGTESRERTLH